MAEPAVRRTLALMLERLRWPATLLLGVTVGVLCGAGIVSLRILGSLAVAGLSTGLGLLLVSAWRSGPARPVPEILATPNRVLALSIGSLALTGWIRSGSYRWGLFAVLAVLGALAQRRVRLLGRGSGVIPRPRLEPRLRARDLADLLGRLPTDVLLAEWEGTGRAVALHPRLRAERDLVQLRALLLDELERRDAKAFAAWQQAWQHGAGRRPSAPEGFLGDGA